MAVVSVSPRGQRLPVYNLEVDGEHVFFVSALTLLAHNTSTCTTTPGGPPNPENNSLPDAPQPTPPSEPPSSRVLAENMEKAGIPGPSDTAAHHIVAGSARSAAPARAALQQDNIGINDARNGVYLPKNSSVPNPNGAQVHSTLHTKAYYSNVNNDIINAELGTREDMLRDIQDQLLGGTYPQ